MDFLLYGENNQRQGGVIHVIATPNLLSILSIQITLQKCANQHKLIEFNSIYWLTV